MSSSSRKGRAMTFRMKGAVGDTGVGDAGIGDDGGGESGTATESYSCSDVNSAHAAHNQSISTPSVTAVR